MTAKGYPWKLPRTVGGKLSAQAYAQLASRRPADETSLRREVHALAERGLTERDIGQLLQLDPTQVRALLGDVPIPSGAARGDEAAEIHRATWRGQR